MFQASGRARDIARKAAWSLTLIGATAVTMGLGFSLLLSNLLVRPLDRVMKATQKVAAGDYDVTVTTDSTDEFGRLSHEFNAMVQKLRAYREINIGQLVAEKRKSEAIIQRIDDGIVVMDHQFMVTSMNPSAAKMLNLQSKQAENRHFLEVVKSGELFDHLKAAAESGTVPMIEEGKNIFTTVEGDIKRHYQFFITPIDVQESHAPGTVLLLRDVSKLWEIDRLKSEFVMAASHELRTPLTSIGMSIDLLMENSTDKLNDQEKQLLAVAHEEIKRLKALVNSLLDLSKIEAGKVALEMQPVAASFLFEKAVSVLANQARDKSIDLSCVTPPGLPDVRADANKITWVLTNIIANALRYTAAGGSVRLSAEQVGPQMHVSVSDNGVGIPYDYQPKIFDKFVQIKGPGTTGGSGLGLAICREIVRAHGGSIWVDSIPGEGSTFTFTLPLAEGQPRGQHP
jgi:NtrC-family two-component system sensor histidine kinase KinB